MAHIRLEAGNDLIQRLAHESDPTKAVVEIIWNSLDADAHDVAIVLHRNNGRQDNFEQNRLAALRLPSIQQTLF